MNRHPGLDTPRGTRVQTRANRRFVLRKDGSVYTFFIGRIWTVVFESQSPRAKHPTLTLDLTNPNHSLLLSTSSSPRKTAAAAHVAIRTLIRGSVQSRDKKASRFDGRHTGQFSQRAEPSGASRTSDQQARASHAATCERGFLLAHAFVFASSGARTSASGVRSIALSAAPEKAGSLEQRPLGFGETPRSRAPWISAAAPCLSRSRIRA